MAAPESPPEASPPILPEDWPVLPAGDGVVDMRDVFIGWLRGEFAAANAIIDVLLGHLLVVDGTAADYDAVVSAINQRRLHWGPILHLQQFFPIAGVDMALQQAAWNRRAPRRQTAGFRNHAASQSPLPYDGLESRRTKSVIKQRESSKAAGNSTSDASSISNNSAARESINHREDAGSCITPTEFLHSEVVEGKLVNIFEGLRLYDGLLELEEVSKLYSWANEARSNRHGGIGGPSILLNKRPMKGHGREVIQLGLPIIDGPPDDESSAIHLRAQKVEPIPSSFSKVLDHLIQQEIVPAEPDYCVVDFFYEGEHSHPLLWPYWYGTAVATLCLTDCEMLFGRNIIGDTKGYHKGPLKLSLLTGSLILHQGRSLELAKRAIPCIRRPRVLLTFGKSRPMKNLSEGTCACTIPSMVLPSLSLAPSVRVNLTQQAPSPMNVGVAPASTLEPGQPPSLQPYQVPHDEMLINVPGYLSHAAMPFQAPASLGNTSTARREAPSMTPTPSSPSLPQGTGVFLPPSTSSSQHGAGVQIGGNASPQASPVKKSDAASPKLHGSGSPNGVVHSAKKAATLCNEKENGGGVKEITGENSADYDAK